MTMMFADDFMGYGTDASLLLNGLWGHMGADIAASPDPLDPVGTKCLHFQGFGNGATRPFVVGPVGKAGCALRLWMPSLPGFETACIRFLDPFGQLYGNLTIVPNGALNVYLGSVNHGGTLIAGTANIPALTANSFHHIEMFLTTSPTDMATGAVKVFVDGNQVIDAAAVITGPAAQLSLGTGNDYNGTASRVDYIKDLVCYNGSGAHNNNILGTVSVVGMTPDSDVSLGWTPSTGTTGWDLINGSPPADGDDYITAPYPAPPPSTFTLTDLPINITSVRAMITQLRARKVDGGDGNLQASLISTGGDTVNGSDRPITTAFSYYEDVFETDPHTGNSWTPSAADNADLKINRTI